MSMAAAAIALVVAGTALQAKGKLDAGKAQQEAAYARAQQLEAQAAVQRRQAVEVTAKGSRAAAEQARLRDVALSNAQAAAAASGGGALDVSVLDILGNLEAEGSYNRRMALYDAETQAQSLRYGAKLNMWQAGVEQTQGRASRKAGRNAAFATVLTGLGEAGMMGAKTFGTGGSTTTGGSEKLVSGGALTNQGSGVWFR